jgi:release factor glutamine methyltransferase
MKINQAFKILSNAGNIRYARIILGDRKKISALRVYWMAHQLRRGVPVAKIIHQKWFYGLSFYTNRHTLDPRPDTETLVEAVINQKSKAISILDMGTGTGCIIAALIKNIPDAIGVGIDKSFLALRVAKKNIRDLGLENKIKIIRGDFYNPSSITHYPFDIIVSNPPYIAAGDNRVNHGAQYDPAIRLYAKNNGLDAYEAIAKNAHKWLKDNGNLYLEIGIGMGDDIKNIFIQYGWKFIYAWDDLGGIQRVLQFQH